MKRKPHARETDTATRIVTAAEIIFSERGYRGVSLREVMRECGVNSAAIHYHFGSKEALLEAIFIRRAGSLNDAREQLLSVCLRKTIDDSRTTESRLTDILRAFLMPAFALPDDNSGGRRFSRLRSALAHENAELSQHLIAKYFNRTSRQFVIALRDVLPEIPESALYWRFHFLLGAQYYTLSQPGRMESIAGASFDRSNLQMALEEMVAFVAAGFSAPLAIHEARVQRDIEPPVAPTSILGTNNASYLNPLNRVVVLALIEESGDFSVVSDTNIDVNAIGVPDLIWNRLEPMLPPPPARRQRQPGRMGITDREAVNGILYLLRNGVRWRDLNKVSGLRSGASCWRRLQMWKEFGCWNDMVIALRFLPDGELLDFQRIT